MGAFQKGHFFESYANNYIDILSIKSDITETSVA